MHTDTRTKHRTQASLTQTLYVQAVAAILQSIIDDPDIVARANIKSHNMGTSNSPAIILTADISPAKILTCAIFPPKFSSHSLYCSYFCVLCRSWMHTDIANIYRQRETTCDQPNGPDT